MQSGSTEMAAAIRGRLISAAFAQTHITRVPGVTAPPPRFEADLERWANRVESILGPASSVRVITDVAVIPLLRLLGFELLGRTDRTSSSLLEIGGGADTRFPVVTVPWNEGLDPIWRDVVHDAIRLDARWCLCSNGQSFRVVDAHRTWSRHYVEFDLRLVAGDEVARSLLWNMVCADAMATRPTRLDVAAELSARHGTAVCQALGAGVLEALTLLFGALRTRKRSPSSDLIFEQSLTVLYRILFLLFAEARAVVPVWHPVYRERYTIDAILSTLMAGRRCRGVWETVLAISRLAHAGCRAGELKVSAFNGRLFSPASSASFDRSKVDDEVMSKAVLAVGTAPTHGGGRGRISYADLNVEQLGAVYEQVLEYQPATDASPSGPALVRTREIRQSSGTFYTPRSVTAFLVRQTLEPLVRDRSAREIIGLRVLDPAMGSGAFLVAACRYLAAAAEQSLVREGKWHPGDVTAADRAALRREVAQRCLFGVDVNPMAVQLARLSLWLASLAADKPLTFLDHHLTVGNSLLGAGFNDVRRQPTATAKRRRPQALPLFSDEEVTPALEYAVGARSAMALQPDDSVDIVAQKGKALTALHAPASPLGRWGRVLDLWCAGWFWEDSPRPTSAVFGALCDAVVHGSAALPAHVRARYLEHASSLASRQRFFHWPIAFPEVFHDERGCALPTPGFDAVIGNPPWDMVRGDSGSDETRLAARQQAHCFTRFIREAGIYRVGSLSHVNRYQLFVERALQLTRPGGRIGLVLPSGFAGDAGAAPLRRHVLDRASIDSLTGLDNRGRFFPIHRSLRFVLLTATAGAPTSSISCRFGVTTAEDLESPGKSPIVLRREMLERLSGSDDLAIPEIGTERDLRILETISARTPWLGAANGWSVRFGRELNATDDRHLFVPFTGRRNATPVVEGKQVEPFRTHVSRCRYELARDAHPVRQPGRARVAYRDVASATNRLTLVAAVIPAKVFTTHTLFCLKTPVSAGAQHVLCALLNSFVANYLVRLRVNTHVTASLVARLPVPVITPQDPTFYRIARLSRTFSRGLDPVETSAEYAELQAIAAHLYGLTATDFEHVLGTFPLIPGAVRENALRMFRDVR